MTLLETFQWIFACIGWALATFAWKDGIDKAKIIRNLNFELLSSTLTKMVIISRWDVWPEKEKLELKKLADEEIEKAKYELNKLKENDTTRI